jgi:hypothetical protein
VFEKSITDSSEAAPSIASMENLHGAIPDACCIEGWLQRYKHGEEEGSLQEIAQSGKKLW